MKAHLQQRNIKAKAEKTCNFSLMILFHLFFFYPFLFFPYVLLRRNSSFGKCHVSKDSIHILKVGEADLQQRYLFRMPSKMTSNGFIIPAPQFKMETHRSLSFGIVWIHWNLLKIDSNRDSKYLKLFSKVYIQSSCWALELLPLF